MLTKTAIALVSCGALLLGFVGYQLWGTGIQHSRAQSSLESNFKELLIDATPTIENQNPASGGSGKVIVSNISERREIAADVEFQLTDSVIDALPLLYRGDGEAIARIQIQRIGLNEIVVEGTKVEDLKKGPGHFSTTPFPGQPGNVSLAGHRTTYGAPFADIQKLQVGDEIIVTTIQGKFTYLVEAIGEDGEAFRIVDPSQIEVVDYQGGNHLTLTSCHPRFSADERIIVRAVLMDDKPPAIPLPRPSQISTGEESFVSETTPANVVAVTDIGLGGDSSALLPTILFGVLLLGLIAGMIIWSKRWVKWRVYSISALPILTAIVFIYYYLDNLLPSF